MKEIRFRAWERKKMKVRKGSKGMYKQNGYVLAKAPYHPHANKRGYVPLHKLLMENQLGRYLMPRRELVFEEIKYRLFDRDKNITQIYTLQELIAKTYRRAKFEFRGRYTGLKDKNGTEIYEGDIVLDKLNNEYGEVVFDEGCFLVLWQEGQNTVYQATREFYIEVVGNVYENKNLLKNE